MNNFENEKIKIAYYGGVIEAIEALVDGYKKAVESNVELFSIEYLDFLANLSIIHAEGILKSFELGKRYLESRNRNIFDITEEK